MFVVQAEEEASIVGEILQSEPLTGSEATKEVSLQMIITHPHLYFDHVGLNWYHNHRYTFLVCHCSPSRRCLPSCARRKQSTLPATSPGSSPPSSSPPLS